MQLSVLTATMLKPEREEYFRQCAEKALELVKMGDGEIDWHIHVDTDEVSIETGFISELTQNENVHVYQQAKGGLFYARNQLLHAADGERVLYLDDDDLLMPSEVFDALTFAKLTNATWLACGLTDLHEDGSTKNFMPQLPEGETAPGQVMAAWDDLSKPCPVILNSTILTKTALLAMGGFPAMRQAGDLAAVVTATNRTKGWVVHAPLYYYRKHATQMMEGENWKAVEAHERKMVAAQANAAIIA